MKKRGLALLLSLVLVLGLCPAAAWAAAGEVEVSFTAQSGGIFLMAPQRGVAVDPGLAEFYQLPDQVTNGVSVLDVLVKAHEVLLGDAFAPETAGDYLAVSSSGFVTKLFGETTSANGFILNGGYAMKDGKGTTVTSQEVADGDQVDFFIYQDQSSWSDQLSWFCVSGQFTDTVTAKPGAQVNLTLKGIGYMSAYLYPTADAMHGAGTPQRSAQLAWVDSQGQLSPLASGLTDDNGAVTVTMPQEEGTYWLSAKKPGSYEPLILTLTKVVVTQDAPEVDPCTLSALSVTDFGTLPAWLTLEPAFSPDTLTYTTPEVAYNSVAYLRMLYVNATPTDPNATITASLNGTEKTLTAGQNTNFSGMVSGDNILTITVTVGTAQKIYTVTVPMAFDPATVAAAQPVIDQITAIGTVTKDSKTAIEAARSAYDALTDGQKAAVKNYQVLVDAEAALANILKNEAAAQAVADQINAIGTVTKDSKTAIDAARSAYDALTDEQKALVPAETLKLLTDAEARYAALIAPITPVGPKPAQPETPAQPQEPEAPQAPAFADVPAGCWYESAVAAVCEKGLMTGTSAEHFSPMADTSRGMIVTILARMDGVDTAAGETWYSAGQAWAIQAGISDGTNMAGSITREQLAAMLYRYAQSKGLAVSAAAQLDAYADSASVSSWARSAMEWAVGAGLIQGSAGQLAPQGTAMRAETAVILARFAQLAQ